MDQSHLRNFQAMVGKVGQDKVLYGCSGPLPAYIQYLKWISVMCLALNAYRLSQEPHSDRKEIVGTDSTASADIPCRVLGHYIYKEHNNEVPERFPGERA